MHCPAEYMCNALVVVFSYQKQTWFYATFSATLKHTVCRAKDNPDTTNKIYKPICLLIKFSTLNVHCSVLYLIMVWHKHKGSKKANWSQEQMCNRMIKISWALLMMADCLCYHMTHCTLPAYQSNQDHNCWLNLPVLTMKTKQYL